MTSATREGRSPGRPKSLTDDELRLRMYKAANELLDETGGLTLSLDHLNLEQVMRRADVSRSAVYRVWPMKEEFNADYFEHLATAVTGRDGTSEDVAKAVSAYDPKTPEVAAQVIFSRPELFQTPEGRRQVQLEAVRIAAKQNFDSITGQSEWRTFNALALTARAVADPARRDLLLGKLREGDAFFTTTMAAFYMGMFQILGLRPRPPFTAESMCSTLAVLGGSIVEGLGLHHAVNPELIAETIEFSGEEWTLPALGFLAVMDLVSEPDPDAVPWSPDQAGGEQ